MVSFRRLALDLATVVVGMVLRVWLLILNTDDAKWLGLQPERLKQRLEDAGPFELLIGSQDVGAIELVSGQLAREATDGRPRGRTESKAAYEFST